MWKDVLDFVFPVFCLGCNKEGEWLCGGCLDDFLKQSFVQACPVCHLNNNSGLLCLTCKPNSYLDKHFAAIEYGEDKLSGKIIHTFKYEYIESVFFVLEKVIEKYLSENTDKFSNIDFVVPVPLHPRRSAERGFNQAELIANKVAFCLKKEMRKDLIVRKKYTSNQAHLGREDRMKNISGAFGLSSDLNIKDKNILLVDDVFTTGSTMQECAKVLKDTEVSCVIGFTIVRG